MERVRAKVLLSATAMILGFTGCGIQAAADRAKKKNLLMQIGLGYHQCHDTLARGPADLEEFKKYSGAGPEANHAVERGDLIIIWGVHIVKDMPNGTSVTVLGYEKDVPAKGGLVLMGDGMVKEMNVREFEAAPRPEKPVK
jgi:hypothetical protein